MKYEIIRLNYEFIGKTIGYIVGKVYGKSWLFLSSVCKGKYKWVTDYTNAKCFNLKTAQKYVDILNDKGEN